MKFRFWVKTGETIMDYVDYKFEVDDKFGEAQCVMIAYAFLEKLNYRNMGIPSITIDDIEIEYNYLCDKIEDGSIILPDEVKRVFLDDTDEMHVTGFSLEILKS